MGIGGPGSDTIVVEEATEPEAVRATSGACPICDEHFGDLSAYTAHLADEHDLVDEDGSESSFGVAPVAPPTDFHPEISVIVIPDELAAQPRRPTETPQRHRPVGLVVLVLALAVGLGALIAMAPDRERRDEELVQRSAEETTTTAPGRRPADAPTGTASQITGRDPGSSGRARPGAATSAAPTVAPATVGAGDPAPTTPTTPVSTPPTTTPTTSPPPPAFALPGTSNAVVERCEQVKNRLLITYSWRFEGGAGWHVPSTYTGDGTGRYLHQLSVPRPVTTTIDSVQVVDQDGNAHDVALRPALSSSAC